MPDLNNINWGMFLVQMVVIALSITLHEFGHAISADRLGDTTPRRQGRITLWPDKHLDPVGSIMIVLSSLFGRGIGWGKPVMVNPDNFKRPKRDMTIVALAGPVMNLALALVFGLALRIICAIYPDTSIDWLNNTISGKFVFSFISLNLLLMFFNLIPIHPLDGGKVLSEMLPFSQSVRFDRFFYQFGPLVLLVLVMSGGQFLGTVLNQPISVCFHLITGLTYG